jgi:hypothetical protein
MSSQHVHNIYSLHVITHYVSALVYTDRLCGLVVTRHNMATTSKLTTAILIIPRTYG